MNLLRYLLPLLCLSSPLLLAQACPEDDYGDFDETLNIPAIFKYEIGLTGSSFTLTYDAHTKENIIKLQTSSGQTIPIDPASANSFLQSNCPGQFTASQKFSSRRTAAAPNATSNIPTGLAAQGVASGDFNGDGLSDAAVVTRLGVSIYLADPSGANRAPKSLAVKSQTEQAIVTADFNGDGKLDLAVIIDGAAGSAASLALFLGVGDGTFNPAVYIATGQQLSNQIALGDFNGDGKPDLAFYGGSTTQANMTGIVVLLGNGDGTFAAPIATLASTVNSMLAVDVDGDGKTDLVIAAQSKLVVLPGKGDGTFASPVTTPFIGSAPFLTSTDLNHDGHLDLVIYEGYLGALVVYFGNGDNTFQPARLYAATSRTYSMATIPLRDGFTAFVVPDRLQGALLLALANPAGELNLPKLQIVAPTGNNQFPTALAADLNGDAKPDVIVATGTGVFVELSQANGTFSAPVPYLPNTQITAAAIADLNNDGSLDLVLTTPTAVIFLPGKGDGTFGSPLSLMASLRTVVFADFNADGSIDLVGLDGNGNLSVLLGNGDGTFKPAVAISLAGTGTPGSLATRDFNGDGKPDLIAGYSGPDNKGSNISFLPGNGDGTFGAPQNIPVPDSFLPNITFTTGDLNGDGKPDLALIFNTPDLTQIAIYNGNGDGTFASPTFLNSNNIPASLTVADIDADGNADLLIGSCCGVAEATYVLGKGDGTFQPEQYLLAGPGPLSFAVSGNVIAVAGYEGLNKFATLSVLKYRAPAAPPTP